jgi:hypothetical protein
VRVRLKARQLRKLPRGEREVELCVSTRLRPLNADNRAAESDSPVREESSPATPLGATQTLRMLHRDKDTAPDSSTNPNNPSSLDSGVESGVESGVDSESRVGFNNPNNTKE